MTGVCPAQSPRTHRRIGSARGLLFLAPGRMLPPLNPATTGTSLSIPWGTGVKLGLPDGQICLCRNRSGPSVAIPKCQSVSMEKPRGFPWSLVSMVMMLEGWGRPYLVGCPRDTSPKTRAVCFLPETLGPPHCLHSPGLPCGCLACLMPTPCTGTLGWFFVNSKKDGERLGRQGPTLSLILQPLSISTLDTKVATGNLRMGGRSHPRPTEKA